MLFEPEQRPTRETTAANAPMDAHVLRLRLARSFGCSRIVLRNEFSLHDAIALHLRKLGIPFQREVRLGAKKRPDFVVGQIAIEVKIEGGELAILRQLKRYADDDGIGSVMLITTRPINAPPRLGNKPIEVLCLWRNLL